MKGFWGPLCNFIWSFPSSQQTKKALAWFLFLLPSFGSNTWREAVHQVCFPFPIMLYSSRPKCCDSICFTSAFFLLYHYSGKNYQTAAFIMLDLWRVGWQYSGKPEVTHKQEDIAFMLYPLTIKFLLSAAIMKILRVLLMWYRILVWQHSSRERCLRMMYEIMHL